MLARRKRRTPFTPGAPYSPPAMQFLAPHSWWEPPLQRLLTGGSRDSFRMTHGRRKGLSTGARGGFGSVGHRGGMMAGGTMYLAGLAGGNRRTEDLGLHSVESILLGSVITGTVKIVAGRARPFASRENARSFKLFRGLKDDNYRSFPSGHATAAFAF